MAVSLSGRLGQTQGRRRSREAIVTSAAPNASGIDRLAGLLSLVSLAAGISAEFGVVDTLTVSGDFAATLRNILASEQLYRLGFVGYLIDYAAYAGATVLLYRLLKHAGATLAVFGLVSSMVGTAIAASLVVHYLAPLTAEAELAQHSLRLRNAGAIVSLLFFGLHLVFVGWLIMKSRLAPWLLGALSVLGGLCFAAHTIIAFLAPPLSASLVPYVLLPGILAQASLALWLLVMGVKTA